MIEYLQWDSDFFNLKTGRTSLYKATASDVSELIEEKQKERYDVVYLFVQHIDADAKQLIFNSGGILADNKTTYHKHIDSNDDIEVSPTIKIYNEALTNELLKLAIDSGHKSRFASDPRLISFFPELYKQWIEKSLTGQLADVVMVYWHNQQITGFVTAKINNKHGQIGLIAVDAQARGRGIGKQLLQAIHQWYFQQQVESCTVVTQLQNNEACRLYEKTGYTLQSVQEIYHL